MTRRFCMTVFASALTTLNVSCGQTKGGTPTASQLDQAGDHYDARHCEIFVDKLQPIGGSHYSVGLVAFVKILPERLDSKATEVGFRRLRTGHDMSGEIHESWQDQRLTAWVGSSDYFYFSSPLSHDFGFYTFEGAFYVRTERGTTYWLKPRYGASGNFVFDAALGRRVAQARGALGYMPDADRALPVNGSPFTFLNPDGCW